MDGELLPATRRCLRGSHDADEQATHPCDASSLFIQKHTDKQVLELVVAPEDEQDVFWTEPYRSWRTIYRKRPQAGTSQDGGALPNTGREQWAFLTHIVRNYDRLAGRTVFLQGKLPSCGGVPLQDGSIHADNHLLSNVSAHDYLEHAFHPDGLPATFMPLTARVNHKLNAISFRTGFAEQGTVPRPISRLPSSGKDGDRWLAWQNLDYAALIQASRTNTSRELITFEQFFHRAVGTAPPQLVYFVPGAQFAASREALQSTSKETYEWILRLLDEEHAEIVFYLELSWHYLLGGRTEGTGKRRLDDHVDFTVNVLNLGSVVRWLLDLVGWWGIMIGGGA
eukprot:4640474-Prymnesium_polylepis.1